MHPFIFYCFLLFNCFWIFILPMSCDSVFCYLIHYVRSKLNFYFFIFRTYYRSMQWSISITLGWGNEIFKPSLNKRKFSMNNSKQSITFSCRIGNNSKGHNIWKLLKRNFFAFNLIPYRIRSFYPTMNTTFCIFFQKNFF